MDDMTILTLEQVIEEAASAAAFERWCELLANAGVYCAGGKPITCAARIRAAALAAHWTTETVVWAADREAIDLSRLPDWGRESLETAPLRGGTVRRVMTAYGWQGRALYVPISGLSRHWEEPCLALRYVGSIASGWLQLVYRSRSDRGIWPTHIVLSDSGDPVRLVAMFAGNDAPSWLPERLVQDVLESHGQAFRLGMGISPCLARKLGFLTAREVRD